MKQEANGVDFRANLRELPRVHMLGQIRQRAGWKNSAQGITIDMLILVRGGDMRFVTGGQTFSLKEGDYLLIPRGQSYQVASEGSCEYVFVHFSLCEPLEEWRSEAETELEKSGALPYSLPPSRPDRMHLPQSSRLEGERERVWLLLTECDMYRSGLTPNRKLRIEVRFAEVLSLLDTGAQSASAADYPAALSRILFHIHERYMQPLTLAGLSEEFGLSRQYVMRLFQRHLRTTVTQYLTRLRLEHSTELLQYSTLQVNEIAEAVGFSSAYYYCRLFHKEFGRTPTQYRKEALKTQQGE